MFEEFGTVKTSREQFGRFKTGKLWNEWANKYPELFDSDDHSSPHNEQLKSLFWIYRRHVFDGDVRGLGQRPTVQLGRIGESDQS